MKSIRMVMLFLVMVTLLRLLAGCAGTCECPHPVDVYVNEAQKFVTLEDDKVIEEIYLHPGDLLIINNRAKDKVTVKFPDGMFDLDEVTIPPNQRVRLKALKAGPVGAGLSTEKNGVIIDGEPKVKVGDGP